MKQCLFYFEVLDGTFVRAIEYAKSKGMDVIAACAVNYPVHQERIETIGISARKPAGITQLS